MQDRPGWFGRLRQTLARTREVLGARVEALLAGPLDPAFYDELEELLVQADLGVPLARVVVDDLRARTAGAAPQAIRAALADILRDRLGPPGRLQLEPTPAVVLVLGVNGSGKTTTIGKLAHRLEREGRRVLLAAADTFRAAAIDQLEAWAARVGVPVIRHREGADPAAVVFDAAQAAQARHVDVLIVDTAGRLHTKVNLMEELKKIDRVVARALPGSPVERLLVLDATTGQNGLAQARAFHQAVRLTGIVITKLDGTAKGGIAVAIAQTLQVPIVFIGTGEGPDDLAPFDPAAFALALLADDGGGVERPGIDGRASPAVP
ncbi:MAG: signal recognition particle-docking protein FtsY [Armatimonadota bacterium]|nr:signal recognition particle-docking protein FtsY [Armatimonadota bacterium]MDR7536056.1 signal recognition particle-docking protein FtsY [Armatimonadota bacterium]